MFPPTDVTNVSGKLLYWCEWSLGGKFMDTNEVFEKWPNMQLNFLQSNVRFEEPVTKVDYLTYEKKGMAEDAMKSFFVGQQIG